MFVETDSKDKDVLTDMKVQRRQITEAQLRKYEGYMSEVFSALGMDMNAPGTVETPQRFIRSLIDITDGYDGDPKLMKVFSTECHGGADCSLSQIIEGPIYFAALCEHHVLPFYGEAYVGYIAHEHIIGLSKLTRLVRMYAKRFTVQERIGRQIADTLNTMLQPHGVAVYLQARHLCTEMRGVRELSPMTRTNFWRGEYENNPALRSEFYVACGLQR